MISRNFLSIVPLLLLAPISWAEQGDDIPGPAICASQEALECTPVQGCARVSLESIDGPQFIGLKPGAPNLIVTLPGGETRTAKVGQRSKLDGRFMFQGVEEADAKAEDAVGWTMLISEDTGRMVVTLAGEDTAVVIFGACTLL